MTLYAFYTGLVYVTPIFGGLIADKITGYRKAVVIGALLMTLGHASMALEGLTGTFFYLGLVLLIIGNGMFKPNISSMVGKLYKTEDKEKDAGYTIFYMGINAGAFLGILLCGYIGESVGWHYGFGLAGIFMFVGMLQFYFAQEIFGKIGLSPKGAEDFDDAMEDTLEETEDAIEDTIEEAKSSKVVSDRLIVIGVLAFFTIFFWWAFEQAGGSMTIFAADYTDRVLEGDGALIFKIFNTLLTVIPMIIITWVLGMLFKQTYAKFALSNILLGLSFVIIWAIVIWMLYRQFTDPAPEVPASWFGILNSFFIIAFAPIFSKIWESKLNPSGPVKFAIGLILLGIGFGILAFGSMGIPLGAKTASVSMIFLILAYLFHTLGELCVSPVGLSYVSKLSPGKLVGLMFGIWFVANFIANTAAGLTGRYIDPIVEDYGMATFFMIFTIIPIAAGFIMLALSRLLVKMMHGIR
ncbi:di-/tripeptide transporter [Nonlabens ulvanivorans]|uniref:Di-/tripeptide transporter n=1 Tax=Nonlabens ulvanivorans TaxID=906888 RepID=A0A090Q870_NONUL|nr:di-/tripeptide transporter [Nonlabens ulvanivorans]